MMLAQHASGPATADVHVFGGARIIVLRGEARTGDLKGLLNGLIGEAWSHHATAIAIPVECLPTEFFLLRTGVAGGMIQRLVNYRMTVAFVGAIPDPFLGSLALRDFIHQCNRGRSTWFVEDMEELRRRLSGRAF